MINSDNDALPLPISTLGLFLRVGARRIVVELGMKTMKTKNELRCAEVDALCVCRALSQRSAAVTFLSRPLSRMTSNTWVCYLISGFGSLAETSNVV